MKCSTQIDGDKGMLFLQGRFEFAAHQVFKQATNPVLEQPGLRQIIVDLAEVEYMDSSSLGLLLLLREKASLKEVKVILANPSPSSARILETVQFGRLFEIR